jgi:SAM-dependent methyltransferase
VLDVGCAFGYGTARLPGSFVVGLDRSADYLRQAKRRYSSLTWVEGDAACLPLASESFDAVVALDVLEHLANAPGAAAELIRVLRPGGRLVVSVPHGGLLAGLDSLNLYRRLRHYLRRLLPLDPTEEGATEHRHFSTIDLQSLFGSEVVIEEVYWSGIGWAELVHLAVLVVCRGVFRSERLYRIARYLYYGLYVVEDLIEPGPLGYHLFIVGRKLGQNIDGAGRIGGVARRDSEPAAR